MYLWVHVPSTCMNVRRQLVGISSVLFYPLGPGNWTQAWWQAPLLMSHLTDLYFNYSTETLYICIFILQLYLYIPFIWKKIHIIIYIIVIEIKGHFSSVLDTTLLPTCPHPIPVLHSSLSHFLGWNWLSLSFMFAYACYCSHLHPHRLTPSY